MNDTSEPDLPARATEPAVPTPPTKDASSGAWSVVRSAGGVPDGPPMWLHRRRERRRVVATAGPERILPEWWRDDGSGRPRDYYRVTTESGAAFWLSRDGQYGDARRPEWRVRGGFA